MNNQEEGETKSGNSKKTASNKYDIESDTPQEMVDHKNIYNKNENNDP